MAADEPVRVDAFVMSEIAVAQISPDKTMLVLVLKDAQGALSGLALTHETAEELVSAIQQAAIRPSPRLGAPN